MSYVSQIMCYACGQALREVYSQPAPSASEVSQFSLAGWSEPDWIESNWASWVPFCASRLYSGDSSLARAWVLGKGATYEALDSLGQPVADKACWIDVTGERPVVKGDDGVSFCAVRNGASVCSELWYHLATGANHSAELCAGC